MEANQFISEVYRRMAARTIADSRNQNRNIRPWDSVVLDPSVSILMTQYREILPEDKNIKILDIGFGRGDFVAACILLGYDNLEAADFGGDVSQVMLGWPPSIRVVHDISTDIGTTLSKHIEQYDFIHLSHVVEHIPKHSLLFNIDAIYRALKPGGLLLVRTPNMEGPCALSSFYVTLGHEYGFSGSNLKSLLEICNFDDVRFIVPKRIMNFRQKIIFGIRSFLINWNRFVHRLFGAANVGGQFGEELVLLATRKDRPPLYSPSLR